MKGRHDANFSYRHSIMSVGVPRILPGDTPGTIQFPQLFSFVLRAPLTKEFLIFPSYCRILGFVGHEASQDIHGRRPT